MLRVTLSLLRLQTRTVQSIKLSIGHTIPRASLTCSPALNISPAVLLARTPAHLYSPRSPRWRPPTPSHAPP